MTTDTTRVTAQVMSKSTLDACDTLAKARNLVECAFMAASTLARHDCEAIQTVTAIAIEQINTVIDDLCGQEGGDA